ncbi:MAG: N-6 DNA methylase [Chromatiales bacterium]|nr:N-6 DNA methylase [Chromatiales bacterium]
MPRFRPWTVERVAIAPSLPGEHRRACEREDYLPKCPRISPRSLTSRARDRRRRPHRQLVNAEMWWRRAATPRENITYEREDFWATASNEQCNFVQHVKSPLEIHGLSAVVVLDNVLFEGCAGETIRRKLVTECDVRALRRLPSDISQPVGARFRAPPPPPRVSGHASTKPRTIKRIKGGSGTKAVAATSRPNLDEFVTLYRPGQTG